MLDGVIPELASLKSSLADQLVYSTQENVVIDIFFEVSADKTPYFLPRAADIAGKRADRNCKEPQNLETKLGL